MYCAVRSSGWHSVSGRASLAGRFACYGWESPLSSWLQIWWDLASRRSDLLHEKTMPEPWLRHCCFSARCLVDGLIQAKVTRGATHTDDALAIGLDPLGFCGRPIL